MLKACWLWFVILKKYVELTRPKIKSRDRIFFTGTWARSRVSGNDRLFPCGSEFGPNRGNPCQPVIQLRPWPVQTQRRLARNIWRNDEFRQNGGYAIAYRICRMAESNWFANHGRFSKVSNAFGLISRCISFLHKFIHHSTNRALPFSQFSKWPKKITSNQAKSIENFHIGLTQIRLTNHRIGLKLGQIATVRKKTSLKQKTPSVFLCHYVFYA